MGRLYLWDMAALFALWETVFSVTGRPLAGCLPARSVLFTWAEKWLQCPISENDRQVLFKEKKVWYNSRGIINYLKEEHLYANDSK